MFSRLLPPLTRARHINVSNSRSRLASTASTMGFAGVDKSPIVRTGFIGAIGNTPLIRLDRLSEETGCNIVAKAEWMQPGGSVKDRAALGLILDAEDRGLLTPGAPGQTVVEGTAGNTGIGLAHVCNARGYELVIYMPNTQSQEKIDLLRALGATVYPVPVAPFTDPANYNHQAADHAKRVNGFWGNQFDNTANKNFHIVSTGPELMTQTGGVLDYFTCATGTGGTFAGVGEYLRTTSPSTRLVLADPPGSVLYAHFTRGVLERTGDGSITEGIGQGRITENMKGAHVDDAVHVPDADSITMVYDLLYKDGIYVGASSALNICAAVQVAQTAPKGSTIATLLCDTASKYQSRLFSAEWLTSKGLFEAVPPAFRHHIE